MTTLIKFALCVCVVLFCRRVDAVEYHVSMKGSDYNEGSVSEPLRNISSAAGIAQAGDTITVHEGIYREMIIPKNGGANDLQRILYRAAVGERVIIKGSEVINNWERDGENIWRVVIPNSFFGKYNPYTDLLEGDWLNKKGFEHHTGEVFLNGKSLFEKSDLNDVRVSDPYPDALDQEASRYTWYSEVDDTKTTIWANFQDVDPNESLVEINVRPSCFYPDKTGVNYITIRGFVLDQAATQWAAPTAEQIGMIGTHWSKGWIIEDNVISNSKCVGITLGKDRSTGQNVWMNNPVKDGATHYNEVIFRALEIGWSREKIGSHIVRNNRISNCGQAGIVGSLGAVYSKIHDNHICDIWAKRIFSGAEMAGIKIHASIDMLITGNRIHNTGRGIWIDWMAQGTRISRNLLYDNTTDDLFSEVNHGPYLVDNNVFLSEIAIRDWSEGGAFVHNWIGGKISIRKVLGRFTPYHFPHSTRVAGLRNIYCGDNRFFNNIFVRQEGIDEEIEEDRADFYGLHGYGIAGFTNKSQGNIYFNGAQPDENEGGFSGFVDDSPMLTLVERAEDLFLEVKIVRLPSHVKTALVTTERMGITAVSEAIYEEVDGTPYTLDEDFLDNQRSRINPMPGPFEGLKEGENVFRISDR